MKLGGEFGRGVGDLTREGLLGARDSGVARLVSFPIVSRVPTR
jgi:hypothetical protein